MAYTLHADLDRMYAAIEQRDNPALRGKPVAVITGVRGPVASASSEARVYGVKSGMPFSIALELCPDLIRVEGRMGMYRRESERFLRICERYGDRVFAYGLDEAWLDLPPYTISVAEAEEIGRKIKADVANEMGVTVSVGVSEDNRLLAKMASDLEKPDGLTTVLLSEMADKLYPLPVRDLFMVGESREEQLKRLGVGTIGELAGLPVELLILHFKKHAGTMLYNYSHGINEPIVPPYLYYGSSRRSMSRTQTLDQDRRDIPFLEAIIYILSINLHRDLKGDDFYASNFHTYVRFEDFTDAQRLGKFQYPIQDLGNIYQNSRNALRHILDLEPRNKKVRALGIRATKLSSGEAVRQRPSPLELLLN